MKFTPIINEIYQVAFIQRKFSGENALNEFNKLFQYEIWIFILISVITLSIILSIKYYLSIKKDLWSSFSTLNLIAFLLSNNSGYKISNLIVF